MSEIRVNEVFLAGRIAKGPVKTEDGMVHLMFDAARGQDPFHCMADGRTAENLLTHCHEGDEVSIEGTMRWVDFPNTGRSLVVYVRYTSYGRKLRTLSQSPGGDR